MQHNSTGLLQPTHQPPVMARSRAAVVYVALLCVCAATAGRAVSDNGAGVLAAPAAVGAGLAADGAVRSPPADPRRSCLSLPFSLCLGSQRTLLHSADAASAHLFGAWSFDDEAALDASEQGADMHPVPLVGPARWGVGQSAYLNGSVASVAQFRRPMRGNEVSVMMWVYLLHDAAGTYRTIVRKGQGWAASPSIQMWPKQRRLHARFATERGESESVDSVAVLPLRRWTHVALVAQGKLVQLYVNGILDAQMVAKAPVRLSADPLVLGGDANEASVTAFVDALRLFEKAVDEDAIIADASGALGTVSPRFTRLGCKACSLEDAINACTVGYHLCSMRELASGAFAVARAQGWFHSSKRVWADNAATLDGGAAALSPEQRAEPRLGICCVDE